MPSYRHFGHLTERPAPIDRLFVSPAVDAIIEQVGERIIDPDIRRMFRQCLPNTLDTTVYTGTNEDGLPDTYIATGDIPAMWLRDSTAQVWPYLRFAKGEPTLADMYRGLIRRQTQYILTDPYANAFIDNSIIPDTHGSNVAPKDAAKGIWERKYELDSLGSFLRLSYGYLAATGDRTPFDSSWINAISAIIKLIQREQATVSRESTPDLYKFTDANGQPHPSVRLQGYGYPGQSVGLIRTVFRPSDDETVYPYNIPANAMMVVTLRQAADILGRLNQPSLRATAKKLARNIQAGIRKYGIVRHPVYGKIFAYEVDGYGSTAIMDDPNAPSLLSLPYLGYAADDDPIYAATRRLVLSNANPFFASGSAISGLTSPHTGVLDQVWPIAIIMQALTSTNEKEISVCLKQLKHSHAGTYFIHESINVDDPSVYTRPWFAWANSLFGELILNLSERHPTPLSQSV
jgi:uncharacterized protein